MKKKLLLFLLLTAFIIDAQEKRASTKAVVIFEASVPFFEPVKAINEEVNINLNTKRGTIAFVVYIDRFSFERSLMQEHFNENYMESQRYPKATFKGIIEMFYLENITADTKEYYIKGKIYIHGKSKHIRVVAKIKKVANGIQLLSNFTLNTDDFNIEIPYIVRSKISKNINIKLNATL